MSFPIEKRARNIERQVIILTAASVTLSRFRQGSMRLANLQRAAGQALVLPFATGKGGKFRFFVGVSITSNTTTIHTAAGNNPKTGVADIIQGSANVTGTTPLASAATASNTNTITINGSTQGGLIGSQIYLEDVGPGVWAVEANLLGSGTSATPFSNS